MHIKEIYRKNKKEIERRFEEFRRTGCSSDKEIFAEMCFCIMTPQSKAVAAEAAVKKLKENSVLYTGSKEKIRQYLRGVRFPNNKASYIVRTRDAFTDCAKIRLKKFLEEKDIYILRDRLVKSVTGYGLKEASHFLRNIGKGSEIAILDRHILKELAAHGVIKKIPESIDRKKYIEIEKKMKEFACRVEIPLDALDMVFWFSETGYFFK